LLADEKGKKMGKSEGNVVFLNEDPNNMYGQIMSWPDGVICNAFELCTNVPLAEIKKITESLKKNKVNPRDLKMKLAWEITKINHGAAKATAAQDNFIKTIQKKELPTEIKTWVAPQDTYNIVDLLVVTQLAGSKSEARRLIEQGAIKVSQNKKIEVIKEVKKEITLKEEVILQRGKLQFLKITR
jgi:tyrosyl-tRNA synthetase